MSQGLGRELCLSLVEFFPNYVIMSLGLSSFVSTVVGEVVIVKSGRPGLNSF